MFEKNLQIGYLLDFYGELLSQRKHSVMEMYYNEDLSLAEIANEIGISRQGVANAITVIMMAVPIITFIISQSNIIETMATSGMKD